MSTFDVDSIKAEPFPFNDADAKFSDEEELIPRCKRKIPYRRRDIEVAVTSAETSSDESNYTAPSHSQTRKSASLMTLATTRSSPEVWIGCDRDDLLQRFYHVSEERDVLWKALQKSGLTMCGIPGKAAMVYSSEEKTLVEEVHALRSGIQIWAEEYFSDHLSRRTSKPYLRRARKLFCDLTENPEAYLEDPEDRSILIQAYIWSELQQKIFSNWQQGCGYVWGGKLGDKQLRPINDTLRNGTLQHAYSMRYPLAID